MPVFWFALSVAGQINVVNTVILFAIIHLLLYPSSNGYNSYMDKDTDSIGGIKNPLPPDKQLLYATVVMDILCVAIAFFISSFIACMLFVYIIFSRLYSYRGIRLKRYPVVGYLTVIINQGGLIFLTVYLACNQNQQAEIPWLLCVASCLLIGGFYPITQVYQHKSDKLDGVLTISMLLGKKGTFIFCAVMYALAFSLLFYYFQANNIDDFYVLQLFFIPVIIYFVVWFFKVIKDETFADFKHTMRMNWIASVCSNLAFITLLIRHQT